MAPHPIPRVHTHHSLDVPLIPSTRGQLYTSDALLALTVFLLGLTLTISLSGQITSQTSSLIDAQRMNTLANRSTQLLIYSPGTPTNWDDATDRNNIAQIGLISTSGEIDPHKISALQDYNNADYNSMLRTLGISEFGWYLQLIDLNKNTLTRIGTAPSNAKQVIVNTLPAYYQGELVYASVQVYRS